MLDLELGGAVDGLRLVVGGHLRCAALVTVVLNRWNCELALLLLPALLGRYAVVEAANSRPQIHFLNGLRLEFLFTAFAYAVVVVVAVVDLFRTSR